MFLVDLEITLASDGQCDVMDSGQTLASVSGTSTQNVFVTRSCLIAVRVSDVTNTPRGFLLTSSVVVSDETWRCSYSEEGHWSDVTFDDSHWPQAHVTDATSMDGASARAKWIWSENTDAQTVYCRKRLCQGMPVPSLSISDLFRNMQPCCFLF